MTYVQPPYTVSGKEIPSQPYTLPSVLEIHFLLGALYDPRPSPPTVFDHLHYAKTAWIKNWREERPGNETRKEWYNTSVKCLLYTFGVRMSCFIAEICNHVNSGVTMNYFQSKLKLLILWVLYTLLHYEQMHRYVIIAFHICQLKILLKHCIYSRVQFIGMGTGCV